MQDASGLLKEALDLLRQYNAAPALQLEVQTACEVRACTPGFCQVCHTAVSPICGQPSSVRALGSLIWQSCQSWPPVLGTSCHEALSPGSCTPNKPHGTARSFSHGFVCLSKAIVDTLPHTAGAAGPGGAAADCPAPA